MSIESLIAYLSITLLLSASPGPVMINAMADAAHFGLSRSFATFMGASLGNLCLIALSALGVALVLAEFPDLFDWIRILGGLYLVYLGIKLWLSHAGFKSETENTSQQNLFLKGFLIAATNPKGIVYFGALFPQFIDPARPWLLQYGLLTFIFLVIDISWMYIYAFSGKKLMYWLSEPQHKRWFNRITGGLLVAAGVGLGFIQ